MIQLYGHELSGNSYKAKLMLSLLGVEYEWIKVDLMAGAHKQPDFLALNPFGQVPVLVDGETVLADAQAILVYLARQYGSEDWLPLDAESLSRVVRWLSTTAGEVRQGPESARLYHLFKMTNIPLDRTNQKSEFILTQLNEHLAEREWLELGHPTIADIAVFPYVALAPDGKIDLTLYPNVLAWIDRVKQLPGFVGMRGIEAPTAA
ncbi:glutathione S-transferase [filamentous cyanobacterium CCP2]|nr:glutathione S-transferase [filamentous cyanobacterium CCP2]